MRNNCDVLLDELKAHVESVIEVEIEKELKNKWCKSVFEDFDKDESQFYLAACNEYLGEFYSMDDEMLLGFVKKENGIDDFENSDDFTHMGQTVYFTAHRIYVFIYNKLAKKERRVFPL